MSVPRETNPMKKPKLAKYAMVSYLPVNILCDWRKQNE